MGGADQHDGFDLRAGQEPDPLGGELVHPGQFAHRPLGHRIKLPFLFLRSTQAKVRGGAITALADERSRID